jgi:hypothetical protein
VQFTELVPRLAQRADRLAVLRSLHCASNDHGLAGTIGLTGSIGGGISLGGQTQAGRLEPALGAVVARLRGERSAALPGFVALGGPLQQGHRRIAGEGGGILGATEDPFRLDYDGRNGVKAPQLQLVDGLSPDGLQGRMELRAALDAASRRMESTAAMAARDRYYEQAAGLLTSAQARESFDLSGEPDELRRKYGKFRFGQCCLVARRLVEAGVRCVQVNWSSHVEPIEDAGDGGWDTHDRNFPQLHDRHGWMLDQAMAALMDDLQERGMLDSTIVIGLGEFGRTPKINGRAGRDHWEHCYSGLLAGGGLKAGVVVGASDGWGQHPAERPMTPGDVHATVLAALGVGASQLTALGLTPQGAAVDELL